MEIYVGLFAGIIAALILWWRSPPKRRLPPGPWGLPIVGYLPFLTKKPYLTLTKLAKRYGNVFSVRLGSLNMLVLNDFQSTKEAFAQDAFIARPPEIAFELNPETMETGAFLGAPWKEQRRLCLHLLRDVGLGKSKMEDHIQEEIHELLQHFEENVGKPFAITSVLGPSMSNNVGSLMFGNRMKFDDPVLQMLNRIITEGSKGAAQLGLIVFFPLLRSILKYLDMGPLKRIRQLNTKLRDHIRSEIDEHERTLDPNNIRDFIDGYLVEMQKRKNDPTFCKPVLQDLVGAFFGAGSETVRQAVEWLMLVSAHHPKAQRRIQDEIWEVIGQSRPPIWPDLQKMPFTNAFMMETMRWMTPTPLNLLRYTVADTELNGYFIPKHTQVVSNQWAIHHDPEYWGPDADDFRPERFLTDDGKDVLKKEQHIPFSIGKRACPGEPLAKVEVFLYFVSILQRFNVKMPDGKQADFEGILGIGLGPKEQEIVFTKAH